MLGIMMTGSIYNYTRNFKMSANWNQKKNTGNYMQKGSVDGVSKNNPLYSEFEHYREQIAKMREQNHPDRVSLYAKLESGKKLSPEELEYLRANDPAAYQKAKEIEAEKENYKQALKRCRTKEDVERFHTTYIASRVAIANSIANNPNIPKLTKMALLVHENAKLLGLEDATMEFKESAHYANMPTDAELKEALEEKAEALRGETEEQETAKTENDTETDETTENMESEEAAESRKPENLPSTDKNESPNELHSPQDTRLPEQPKKPSKTASAHSSKAANRPKPAAPRHTGFVQTGAQNTAHTFEPDAFRFSNAYGREIYRQGMESPDKPESILGRHKKA